MDKEFEDRLVRFRNLPMPVRVVYGRARTLITATVHGIVSFVFNTALLALMVNIAASAI